MSHAAAVVAVPRVIRHELPRPPIFSAPQVNARPVEAIGAQEAPDPPRQGDTPARPARMPVYVSLAIDAYHAVMQDFFFVRIQDGPAPRVSMPSGSMTAFADRANIRSSRPVPYGSQVTWDATLGPEFVPVGER